MHVKVLELWLWWNFANQESLLREKGSGTRTGQGLTLSFSSRSTSVTFGSCLPLSFPYVLPFFLEYSFLSGFFGGAEQSPVIQSHVPVLCGANCTFPAVFSVFVFKSETLSA